MNSCARSTERLQAGKSAASPILRDPRRNLLDVAVDEVFAPPHRSPALISTPESLERLLGVRDEGRAPAARGMLRFAFTGTFCAV